MKIEELLNELDFPRKRLLTPRDRIAVDPDIGNWNLQLSKLPLKMPAITGDEEKFIAKLTHKRKPNTYIYGIGDSQEEAKSNAVAKLTPRDLAPTEYSSITADLNAPFTTAYLKDDATPWFKFDTENGEPVMIMASKEFFSHLGPEIKELGFRRASKGRTTTKGAATPIFGFPILKSDMKRAGLIPNMRYTLEYTTDNDDGNAVFVMNPDSVTQGPQDKYRMGVPGVTIAATAINEDWDDEDDYDNPERMQEMYVDEMHHAINDCDPESFVLMYLSAEDYLGASGLIKDIANYISPADESKEHLMKLLLTTIKYEIKEYNGVLTATSGLFKALKKNRVTWPELAVVAKSLKADSSIREDKIKGADGKACWKGYRYAGTENGKDKCIPVKKAK